MKLRTALNVQDDPALASALDWLRRFEAEHGRPLRVLHIGNIANNAYINAKIQRRVGIEADVICHDYYHVMACPEWEDVDFSGDIGDPMYPDWWGVDLNGYRRPAWFAQAPSTLAIRYLRAQRESSAIVRRFWACLLAAARWSICRRTATARLTRRLVRSGYRALRQLSTQIRHVRFIRPALGRTARSLRLRRRAPRPALLASGDVEQRIHQAIQSFRAAFPEREDQLTAADLETYAYWASREWAPLLQHYDVVQAYATMGIIPLLAGFQNYVAYEHGTIRDIPFENDCQGRLCALTYRLAPLTILTNSDNLVAADRLGVPRKRRVYLPHAFDEDPLLAYEAQRRTDRANSNSITFFAPARHHWSTGFPSWRKANDLIVDAAAKLLNEGLQFRIVFVEWGAEVELTKRLVAQRGVEDLVSWLPVMPKRRLWDQYLAADCVIDQFVMPALGSVGFEAMTLGVPLITRIDISQTTEFFGEPPPVLNAATADELAEAMRFIISSPEARQALGRRCREWVMAYHSSRRILLLELNAYHNMLEGNRCLH